MKYDNYQLIDFFLKEPMKSVGSTPVIFSVLYSAFGLNTDCLTFPTLDLM